MKGGTRCSECVACEVTRSAQTLSSMMTYPSLSKTTFLLMFIIGASAFVDRSLDNRIIGGYESTQWDFNYQLSLEGAPNFMHVCGASILQTKWALTAAHCVYNKPLRSLRFRAGSTTKGEGGTLHYVRFYLYHDLYRLKTLDYDLALVRVRAPFIFGPQLQRVYLPRAPPHWGETGTVTGWGFLDKDLLRKPKRLIAADVKVIPWDACKKIYPNLTPRMMCAGAKDIDFCSGDSGGPLTRPSMEQLGFLSPSVEQLGVVSWLYKCGDGLPGVYANITSMMPWIMESLQKYGVYLEDYTSPSYSSLGIMSHLEPEGTFMFP